MVKATAGSQGLQPTEFVFAPRDAKAGPIWRSYSSIHQLKRLLENCVSPVDLLDPVRRRRCGEQMHAELWHQMR